MKKALLHQILVFTILGKTLKKKYSNNKFKKSSPTWNDIFFLAIITMYIDSLATNTSKIKIVIHKTYRRHIPLTVNSVHRLNIKNIKYL